MSYKKSQHRHFLPPYTFPPLNPNRLMRLKVALTVYYLLLHFLKQLSLNSPKVGSISFHSPK